MCLCYQQRGNRDCCCNFDLDLLVGRAKSWAGAACTKVSPRGLGPEGPAGLPCFLEYFLVFSSRVYQELPTFLLKDWVTGDFRLCEPRGKIRTSAVLINHFKR